MTVPTVVLLAATPLVAGGPAEAKTKTAHDPKKDAWAAVDITRATFTNNGKYATARLKIADLRWRGEFGLSLWTDDPEEGFLSVDLHAHRNHTIRVDCGVTSRGGSEKVDCSGITVRYRAKKDVVTFAVPRSRIPRISGHPGITFEASTIRWTHHGKRVGSTDGARRFVKHN